MTNLCNAIIGPLVRIANQGRVLVVNWDPLKVDLIPAVKKSSLFHWCRGEILDLYNKLVSKKHSCIIIIIESSLIILKNSKWDNRSPAIAFANMASSWKKITSVNSTRQKWYLLDCPINQRSSLTSFSWLKFTNN